MFLQECFCSNVLTVMFLQECFCRNVFAGMFLQECFCRRSEEHTSELQSQSNIVCRLLLEKKNRRRRGRCQAAGWADRHSGPARERRGRMRGSWMSGREARRPQSAHASDYVRLYQLVVIFC